MNASIIKDTKSDADHKTYATSRLFNTLLRIAYLHSFH